MSVQPSTELADFQQFVGEHVQRGLALSPEEVLDLWRAMHPTPAALDEDVEAVREALAELDAGEPGMTIEEFAAEFKRRYGISERE
jgi:hypothetical protein